MNRETGQMIFDRFIREYRHDLAKFVREVYGVAPWPWQAEASAEYDKSVDAQGRLSIRSGHGVGKTAWFSWVMCHRLTCFFPQKTMVTAPSSAQLDDALWPEFKTWLGRLPPLLQELFEIKSDRV